MNVTAFQIAQRFLGLKEAAGATSNPLVLGMLQLDTAWVQHDQTPWCSAYVNFICHVLGLPRSRSLAARSWLLVGISVPLTDARPDFDVVILSRGKLPQPGASVLQAPGHVGFFAGRDDAQSTVQILGGNQGDVVSIQSFPKARVLGVRRLVT